MPISARGASSPSTPCSRLPQTNARVSRTSPFYRFDPNLGNPHDQYTRAETAHPEIHQPEVPGVFEATVEGETIINTMHGVRSVAWRTEPGTPCVILGYWADGTVHLRWAAIAGHYRIDGRFPAWVARADPEARMAGGGRILSANNPPVPRPGVPGRIILLFVLIGIALILLALPPVHDGLGEIIRSIP